MFQLDDQKLEKPKHLIQHDILALQFTNDQIINSNQLGFAYDKSLISFSKTDVYNGHVTTPAKFIDITESTKLLPYTFTYQRFLSIHQPINHMSSIKDMENNKLAQPSGNTGSNRVL